MLPTYLKYGGIAAVLILLCGTFYHLGGSATRAATEAAHAAQLGAVVSALETQRNAALTESGRRQGIIDAYDRTKDVPTPIVAGLAHRVYLYASHPGCDPVPSVAALASGVAASAAIPEGSASVERLSRLTQDIFDASDRDANQMNAMIELATPSKPPR